MLSFWHFGRCTCAMIHLSCRQAWCQVFTSACNQLSSLTLSLHDLVNRRTYCTLHHTHTRAQSQTHTRRTEPEPTWVVKLAACISGIDLLGIKPCHCCHLNFGLGASSNPQPPHPPPAPPQTPHTITTNSFLCTIFIRVENGWDTNRAFHNDMAVPPSSNWQTSYDSLD